MLPTKAERILSRYRPIAPKPAPVGSFGSADPSSTCASLDSFATSSAKCKRFRKRRIQPVSFSGKAAKVPKPIGSGASSLTQAPSDGTVPPSNMQVERPIPHSSRVHGVEGGVDMAIRNALDTRAPSDARFNGTPQQCVDDEASFVRKQGASTYGVAIAHHQHQQQFSLLHQNPPANNPRGHGSIEKDAEFMERAAASTATLLTDRSIPMQACDGKYTSYVRGGFTEMIRGITRLPTTADVQSLMQSRAYPAPIIGEVALCAASSAGAEDCPPPPSMPNNMMAKSSSLTHLVEECQNNTELVTLHLLPTSPLRMCTSQATARTSPSTAKHSMRGPSHHLSSYGCEHPSNSLTYARTYSRMVSGIPVFTSPLRRHNEVELSNMGSTSTSASVTNGAVMDEVYLEQVYGGSADPVLLLDDSNQVLWFNKAYDRALKSTLERISGKVVSTGPYIDPLGHPTPLGSFVLPVDGMSFKVRNATLWGFLKKLVMHENEEPRPQGPLSHLNFYVRDSCELTPSTCGEAAGWTREVTSVVEHLRPTMLTLETVTELHMEAPAAAESMETAEARLGAGMEPALITDCLSRVRWANTALKQMVGHLSVKSSNSHGRTPGGNGLLDASCSDASTFVISGAERIPHSAWAFSCRVNLEWMKGTKRRAMIVPCDVARLAGSSKSSDIFWVWKFDMAVSLSLTYPC